MDNCTIHSVDDHFVGEELLINGQFRIIDYFKIVQKHGDMAYIDWYVGFDKDDDVVIELNSLLTKEVIHKKGESE